MSLMSLLSMLNDADPSEEHVKIAVDNYRKMVDVISELIQKEERLKVLVIDSNDPESLINIDLTDCYYWRLISKHPRRIHYYHKSGNVYEGVVLMDDFDTCSKIYNLDLWRLDNSNYVNMKLITEYDSVRGQVFFNQEKIPAAEVARVHKKTVKRYLESK
ncbi:hypothetical protein [Paenibacillus tyrfis]|uniref:HTH LytTR-type domain-containing protein n=1 Tax=Paenibacillus tyrfis TaxID=1501230 RepID=A0A081P4C2_9BACL|nr:hypothetical protein [Paenibacillus tyrfis]KEQ25545.1 hypothetical protein ET33_02145 [Paenibacillus tyrfis]